MATRLGSGRSQKKAYDSGVRTSDQPTNQPTNQPTDDELNAILKFIPTLKFIPAPPSGERVRDSREGFTDDEQIAILEY